MIALDKAIRDTIGIKMYPATVWCDNLAAVKNTQMVGCNKLNYFDDSLESIKANLESREREGRKRNMTDTHGDSIKSYVSQERIIVKWVNANENIADIFTKPLAFDRHKKLRDILLNS